MRRQLHEPAALDDTLVAKLGALTVKGMLAVLAAGGCDLPAYAGPECQPCEGGCPGELSCEGGQCIDPEHPETCPAGEVPECDTYCRTVGVACQGALAVYPSSEACLATCALLDLGNVSDEGVDTLGCRLRHAVSALEDPLGHCPHAGPTGDGQCGSDGDGHFGACAPYCRVAAAACPEDFAQAWRRSDGCLAKCNRNGEAFGAAADQDYSVERAEVSGATLGCRISHAVRALARFEEPLCDAAFGAAPCME